MKISVFPKSKALPISKEEKSKNAWYTSKPHKPVIRTVKTDEELVDIICNNTWSPSIFKEYRSQADFISTDFMVLDIDEGMTINEAEKVVHKLDVACLCLPSTSFTEELHKFRLVFPLSQSITKESIFKATMTKLTDYFPADPACIGDSGRFFFGGKLVDGFWFEADLMKPIVPEKPKNTEIKRYDSKEVVPVPEDVNELVEQLFGEKRTTVPDNIIHFLENAPSGLAGEMYASGNSFLFTSALMNCEYDNIMDVFNIVYPYDITNAVEKMVDKIINEGYNAREEL